MPEPLSQTRRSEHLDEGPFVVVVNRTSRPLNIRADGRTFTMKPGRNPGIPHRIADYGVRQHPRLGTFDKTMGGGESLLGVEGFTPREQLTAIPPGKEHLGRELVDREAFPQGPERGQTVLEDLPPRRRVEERNPLAKEKTEIDMIHETP